MTDLEALAKLAAEATPGPWRQERSWVWGLSESGYAELDECAACSADHSDADSAADSAADAERTWRRNRLIELLAQESHP